MLVVVKGLKARISRTPEKIVRKDAQAYSMRRQGDMVYKNMSRLEYNLFNRPRRIEERMYKCLRRL